MRRAVAYLCIAVVTFTAACSNDSKQPARVVSVSVAPPSVDVEEFLTRAEREKAVDLASGRWEERWIADDFITTLASGQLQHYSRMEAREAFKSGTYKVESAAVDNVRTRVFGDAAVVTAVQTEKSQFNGRDSSGRFQYTHVWIKRNDRWQVVAAHVTRLQQPTP